MGAKSDAPVVIKRKKVSGGDGHHGGAWKVAYADFVTAMMAFFMLMWLLNATTETQRKGIADYFSPTIPINRISGGGDGSFGGDSLFTEETLAQNGTGATAHGTSDAEEDAAEENSGKSADMGALQAVEAALSGNSGESDISDHALRHIVTRVTEDGLIVELFDLPGDPLFASDTNEPTAVLHTLLTDIADAFSLVTNQIALNGYVASRPIVLVNNPNWDLSTARADRVRQLLQFAGTDPSQIQRVTGYSDREPADENRMAVRNNRIELILLRDPTGQNG